MSEKYASITFSCLRTHTRGDNMQAKLRRHILAIRDVANCLLHA